MDPRLRGDDIGACGDNIGACGYDIDLCSDDTNFSNKTSYIPLINEELIDEVLFGKELGVPELLTGA